MPGNERNNFELLTFTLRFIAFVQTPLGLAFLLAPEFTSRMFGLDPARGWVNWLFGMMAARDPARARPWITSMMVIQLVDRLVTVKYLALGAVTLAQVSTASFLPVLFVVALLVGLRRILNKIFWVKLARNKKIRSMKRKSESRIHATPEVCTCAQRVEMNIVGAERTAAALPFDRLIEALRAMFIAGCVVPPRLVLQPSETMTSLIMPAWIAGEHYMVKIVNIGRDNAVRSLPGLHASVLLHDARTGEPLALIDGGTVTARRTAAASALAASYLARSDARHLLIVGAGRVAELLPAAYRVVRPIERVTVWARRPQAARRMVESLCAQGFAAATADDLRTAVLEADIVSCATMATEPVIRGAWLHAGQHLDLIGSFTPEMREADDACWSGAAIFVDTDEAWVKSGDMVGPLARGVFTLADVRANLADLCSGRAPGRRNDEERTVFKSVGNALEDFVAARLVHAAVDEEKNEVF